MLKIAIIDDEALVRMGLKSMVPWEELGYQLIGEAGNGQSGLDLITNLKPDIVITDIKMPVMDGLEMIRLSERVNYKPKFIVLSSYDEFQLVKQAMKLGVEEYLIKLDLEPEILINTLAMIKEKILAKNQQANSTVRIEKGLHDNIALLQEGFFKRLIDRPLQDQTEITNQVAYLKIDLNEASLGCLLIRINQMNLLDKYDPNDLRVLEQSFLNMINEIVNDVFKGYTFGWNQGKFVVIFLKDVHLPIDQYYTKILSISERLIQVLKQYFNIPVSIGISNLHQGYQELAQAYFESCRAVQYGFGSDSKTIFFFKDIPKTGNDENRIDILEIRNILPKAIEYYELESIHQVFEKVIIHLSEKKGSRGQAFDLCFQLIYLINATNGITEEAMKEIITYDQTIYESILSLNTIPEIIHWLTALEQGLCRYLTRNEDHRNHRLVAKAKKYIMEHYAGDLNLNEIANALSISPGYFSTIFKQYTGVGFTDYVTEIKIEQAKKLLRETDYKIYEISNMLNYQNAYYFSKVFKKVTGMTPSEFSGKQQ